MLIDVPGATPSQLVLALGKDGNAYLLNRKYFGGIIAPVALANVDGVIRDKRPPLIAQVREHICFPRRHQRCFGL